MAVDGAAPAAPTSMDAPSHAGSSFTSTGGPCLRASVDGTPVDALESTTTLPAHSTFLYSHPACVRHRVKGHPERPERVQVILERLVDVFPLMPHITTSPQATLEQLHAFHTPLHVNAVLKWCGKIERSMEELDRIATDSRPTTEARRETLMQYTSLDIDGDTTIMRYTREAALHAAGAACAAVDAVMAGACANAFCAVRPPGHHAEPHKAMGFCFFNNIGVAAMHAIAAHGLQRVAIVDFDVHHGNGTDTKARSATELLYISTHQKPPCFPGTGVASENTAAVCNVEMDVSTSSSTFRSKFLAQVEPKLRAYDPELLLISAGFDAHRDDPLASVNLTADDFYWVTARLAHVAAASPSCRGRTVSVLEGGYHLRALADSAEAHVRALTEASRAASVAPCTDEAISVEAILCEGVDALSMQDDARDRPSLRVTLSSLQGKTKKIKSVVVVLHGGVDAQWAQLCQAAAAKLNMKKTHKLRTKRGGVVASADALLALDNDVVLYLS